MNISLTAPLEALVKKEKVASGVYNNASEVVRTGQRGSCTNGISRTRPSLNGCGQAALEL